MTPPLCKLLKQTFGIRHLSKLQCSGRSCFWFVIFYKFYTCINVNPRGFNGSVNIPESCDFRSQFDPLTLFLLGGGVNLTPPVVFLHNSKSIGLRLLKFSDFSYIPKALHLGLKPGFNTNCPLPLVRFW